MSNLEALSLVLEELALITAPALLIGLMVAVVHVRFGIEVLRRGIIFIDLSVAQIATLGIVVSRLLFNTHNIIVTSGAALIFALLAGALFRFIEVKNPKNQEAWIGVFYVLPASLIILLLINEPHGAQELQNTLSGQILFSTFTDVIVFLPLFAGILLCSPLVNKTDGGIGFYILFALTITTSVQLVGIYVVFITLVVPALIAGNRPKAQRVAMTFTVTAMIMSILISTLVDLPTGPSIVVGYGVLALMLLIINPKNNQSAS